MNPKKDPAEKASEMIPFRFTTKERRIIEAVAKAEGKTMVGLVRDLVRQRAEQLGISFDFKLEQKDTTASKKWRIGSDGKAGRVRA